MPQQVQPDAANEKMKIKMQFQEECAQEQKEALQRMEIFINHCALNDTLQNCMTTANYKILLADTSEDELRWCIDNKMERLF